MRKITSILLLGIFFLLQYGKIVSYWHCKIVASTASNSHCDCEDVVNGKTKNNPPANDVHTIAKEKSLEVFTINSQQSLQNISILTATVISSSYNSNCLRGFVIPVFQPPCFISWAFKFYFICLLLYNRFNFGWYAFISKRYAVTRRISGRLKRVIRIIIS